MNPPRVDVAVIGGGLMGLSVALSARERGMSVAVFEAETCARHASSASAGGVRSLNRHPAEIAISRASLPLWEGLSARLGQDCGFKVTGQLRVAEDEAALEALEVRAEKTRGLGWSHEKLITRADLMTRIPALAGHCHGALVVEDDGFADPLATSHAYRSAVARAGVTVLENTRIVVLENTGTAFRLRAGRETFESSSVINATGAWGDRLARLAGTDLPLRPVALQMTVTERLPAFVDQVVGSQGRKLSLKQSDAGSVVIGGAYEGHVVAGGHGPVRGNPLFDLAARNLASAVMLFPVLRGARVARMWAGLEGMTPDGLPVLGPDPTMPGLIHAFGFSAHGFALVPLIGPLVAGLLEGRAPEHTIEPFSPLRFDNAAKDRLTGDGQGGAGA